MTEVIDERYNPYIPYSIKLLYQLTVKKYTSTLYLESDFLDTPSGSDSVLILKGS